MRWVVSMVAVSLAALAVAAFALMTYQLAIAWDLAGRSGIQEGVSRMGERASLYLIAGTVAAALVVVLTRNARRRSRM